MPKFDYSAPAEIFGTGRNARTRQRVAYRRFHSGAEAVRFAVEDIPAPLLVGRRAGIRRGPLRSPRHPRPLRSRAVSARPPCRRGLAAAASLSAGRSRSAASTACSRPAPIEVETDEEFLEGALLPGLAPRRHLARPAARRQKRLLRDDPHRPGRARGRRAPRRRGRRVGRRCRLSGHGAVHNSIALDDFGAAASAAAFSPPWRPLDKPPARPLSCRKRGAPPRIFGNAQVERGRQRVAVLQLNKISKHFGAITALTEVDLALEPGEVLGLMGDNGAGKSTLVKIIAGNFPPSSGEIVLDDQPVQFHKPVEARAEGDRGRLPGPRALRQPDGRRQRLPRPRDRPQRVGPFRFLDFRAMYAARRRALRAS